MTQTILTLAVKALREHASNLGDRTCDDCRWPDDIPVGLRLKLVEAFHEYNGDDDAEWLADDLETARKGGIWSESSLVTAVAHLLATT